MQRVNQTSWKVNATRSKNAKEVNKGLPLKEKRTSKELNSGEAKTPCLPG
jgi:hypothetical protein